MRRKTIQKARKTTPVRRQYTGKFRRESLLLAVRVGVTAASGQLGAPVSLPYSWQGKARTARKDAQVEREQAAEIARLKRLLADQAEENAILKKAAAYFARTSK